MSWKNEPELNTGDTKIDRSTSTSDYSTTIDHSIDIEPQSTQTVNSNAVINFDSAVKQIVKEIKRGWRWNFALKVIAWLILLGLVGSVFTNQHNPIAGNHTALVRLDGVIGDGNEASAENMLLGLKNAFKAKGAKGVILAVNSPGGSPVQADLLYQEIQRLKLIYKKPFVAVIGDIGASGGYYAAVAADSIYANPASIVGSIGVLMNGFGFVDLMEKLGVERRLLVAGDHKGALDQFSPLKDEDVKHATKVINGVHQQFIDVVRKSRGSRLKETKNMFSGMFWNGTQAYQMGLTDGFKTKWTVAREDIGEEKIVDYTPTQDVIDKFSKSLGVSISETISTRLGLSGVKFQ